MTVFDRLPVEILQNIFSNLPSIDLVHLSDLSHHLNAVVLPLLYKNPCLITGPAREDYQTGPPGGHGLQKHTSLELFLRTLISLQGKFIATNVRFLKIDWCHDQGLPLYSNANGAEAISIIANRAIRRGFESTPLSSPSAQFILLLLCLPRLHTLHITCLDLNWSFDHLMQYQFRDQTASILPAAFQSLTEFRYTGNIDSGISSESLLILFTFPNIRTIDIIMDECEDFYTTPALSVSPVTNLRLTCPFNVPGQLGYLLTVPIALKYFSFTTAPPGISLVRFGQALKPLRNSLQELHLDMDAEPDWDSSDEEIEEDHDDDGDGPHTIGKFRDWPHLVTVRSSLMPLLGRGPHRDTPLLADVLPACVRKLEVSMDHYWLIEEVVEQLVQLVEYKELVPSLEWLAVEGLGSDDQEMLIVLEKACRLAGVVFVDSTTG